MNLGVDTVKPAVVAIDLHRGHLDPSVATMPLAADRAAKVVAANARFFERCRAAGSACNLHVFPAGCEEPGRMLAFRDRLRSREADRRRYESAKRELAARTWRHVQHYADAKGAVVREILARDMAS